MILLLYFYVCATLVYFVSVVNFKMLLLQLSFSYYNLITFERESGLACVYFSTRISILYQKLVRKRIYDLILSQLIRAVWQ
jgi:hypothetical protein